MKCSNIDNWFFSVFSFNSLILSLLLLSLFQNVLAVETSILPTTGQGNLNTIITPNGNNYEIQGGEQQGSNLFHSFHEFNVGAGDTGKFINNTGVSISNIVSRVTGGQLSEINGGIDTQSFPNASFYFINPAGIIFGANASLNINGSFHASTADYLTLVDGFKFYADPSRQTLLLTTAAPSAFGFLQESPTSISINNSSLTVKQGETLSLTAGDINFHEGQLIAPAGKLVLTSVAGAREVNLSPESNSLLEDGGNITLMNNSQLNTDGKSGGRIVIRGGNLVIDNSSVVSKTLGEQNGTGIDIALSENLTVKNAGSIVASTEGTGAGGNINVHASEVLLEGGQVNAYTFGDGQGGEINVQANNITIVPDTEENGARISAVTLFGSGDAGNISLSVGTLSIADDNLVGSLSFDTATGNSGDINVQADEIYLIRGGRIIADSANRGDGGDLIISATKLISLQGVHYTNGGDDFIGAGLFSDSERGGDGNSGNIFVSTPELILQGGKIGASVNTLGEGKGGEIIINADRLMVTDDLDGNPSQITVTTKGSGNAGIISLNINNLLVEGSSVIGAFSRSAAIGDAGEINIQAGQIVLSSGGSINTTSSGSGNGGDINVTATESITLQGSTENANNRLLASGLYSDNKIAGNGGRITLTTPRLIIEGGKIAARSSGDGSGGEITLLADHLTMRADSASRDASITVVNKGKSDIGNINIQTNSIKLSNSSITAANTSVLESTDQMDNTITQTFPRNGGNISIQATNFIHLFDSEISTKVGVGNGEGGNVSLNANVVVMDGSQIIADAVRGNGGNIKIKANAFLKSPDSLLSAFSELGIDGDIVINSPITDIISTIQHLPADFLNVSSILSTPCSQRSGVNTSSLIIRRYDVLPDSPYALRTNNTRAQQSTFPKNTSQLLDDTC